MNVQQKMKMITTNDALWEDMKSHVEEMRAFLAEYEGGEESIVVLLYNSLRLVVVEFLINKEMCLDYPSVDCESEEFGKRMQELLNIDVPSLEDVAANEKCIEDVRVFIWGYIRKYIKEMPKLLSDLTNPGSTHVLTLEEMTILRECMTVVLSECLLRIRESMLLERSV